MLIFTDLKCINCRLYQYIYKFQTLARTGLFNSICDWKTWHAATESCVLAGPAQLPTWSCVFCRWLVKRPTRSQGRLSAWTNTGRYTTKIRCSVMQITSSVLLYIILSMVLCVLNHWYNTCKQWFLLLQDHAISLMAAYGSSKDINVYSSIGLKPEQIYIVGKASKKQQANSQVMFKSSSYFLVVKNVNNRIYGLKKQTYQVLYSHRSVAGLL